MPSLSILILKQCGQNHEKIEYIVLFTSHTFTIAMTSEYLVTWRLFAPYICHEWSRMVQLLCLPTGDKSGVMIKNEPNCAVRADSFILQYKLDRAEVVKSVGPKLVPFLKTVCVYFVAWLPETEKPTVFAALLKILPILCLGGFVSLQGISLEKQHNYSRRILLGLIFSGIGDVFLVWKNTYFIHGMAAFGIAHILYIRALGFQPLNWLVGLLCVFPGLLMYYMCYPGLKGILVIAVLIYGFIITGMMWRAITGVQNQIEENGLCRWTRMSACIGAALFYLSDNIIAINKFCFPVPGARALIMTTYYAGQMGIAVSAFNIDEEYNLRMKSSKKIE